MADSESQLSTESEASASPQSSIWTRTGVALLGLSLLLWIPLPVVPFLPLSVGAGTAVAGGLVVGAEIAFWAGAALAGPEVVWRMRSKIRGILERRR